MTDRRPLASFPGRLAAAALTGLALLPAGAAAQEGADPTIEVAPGDRGGAAERDRELGRRFGQPEDGARPGRVEGIVAARWSLLRVRTAHGEQWAYVPPALLRRMEAEVNPGDRVELTGITREVDGEDVLYASDFVITKRDAGGQAKGGVEAGTFVGTVEDVRRVRLREAPDRELFLVRLSDGRTALIDAGLDRRAQTVVIRRGDRLDARGREEDVGGSTVLVTDRLVVGERTDAVAAGPQVRAESDAAVIGQVDGWWTEPLGGDGLPHTIVRITLPGGEWILAALSPDVSPRILDLDRGTWISVRGSMRQVDGRHYLFADSLVVRAERR